MASPVYATSADYARLYLAGQSSDTLDEVTITVSSDGHTATITSPDLVDGEDGTATVVNLPDNIDVLLRSASRLVTPAIRTAVYLVGSDGLPSDTGQRDALVEATCAQVATWVAAGVTDPAGGGLTAKAAVSSKSLNGKSITYDSSLTSSVTAFQARQAMTSTLCGEARELLADAGLSSTRVWTFG